MMGGERNEEAQDGQDEQAAAWTAAELQECPGRLHAALRRQVKPDFVPVTGPGFTVPCLFCNAPARHENLSWPLLTGAWPGPPPTTLWADLNGPAFKAYYHPACKEAVLAEVEEEKEK